MSSSQHPLYLSSPGSSCGIGNLGIVLQKNGRNETLLESDDKFTTLAAAINIGLEILETPNGREALAMLGHRLCRSWQRSNIGFGGDPHYMDRYVAHFLQAMRSNFPVVFPEDLDSPDNLGLTRRIERIWNGDLLNLNPKGCVGFTFNLERVNCMANASAVRKPTEAMQRKYQYFMFVMSTAVSHEMCHAFVSYLGQCRPHTYTPKDISHLNYATYDPSGDMGGTGTGESGRWVENYLFGGALEFYRNGREDNTQPGVPHLVDSDAISQKISPVTIRVLVRSAAERHVAMPFACEGERLNSRQRRQKGIASLGSGLPTTAGRSSGVRYMTAGRPIPPTQPLAFFSVSFQKLHQVAVNPWGLRRVA